MFLALDRAKKFQKCQCRFAKGTEKLCRNSRIFLLVRAQVSRGKIRLRFGSFQPTEEKNIEELAQSKIVCGFRIPRASYILNRKKTWQIQDAF